ncbi:metallo-beta-lactamase [Ephemerocybe angulata]|uniref:Metallo-beta-lactamase n=1 Tax=Ephemerocybe angulata TaxID=980116 RepID=A0A8H6MGV3_9AGAR|nr:metallo-beta-lactamase [Tulosesus angulatus]
MQNCLAVAHRCRARSVSKPIHRALTKVSSYGRILTPHPPLEAIPIHSRSSIPSAFSARRFATRATAPAPETPASAESDPSQPTCTAISPTLEQPNVYSFFERGTSTWQYVIADPNTLKAVIVDPVLDYDPASGAISTTTADGLLAFVKSNNLDIVMLLETHAHADHITAAQYLSKKLGGIPVAIGKRIVTVQERIAKIYWGTKRMYWEDGERFKIGEIECSVIHLPGHTPDHVGYMCGENLFVGDTIFYPDVGSARADFPGGSPTDLYNSIQRVLAMSPNTRVYAGHDYPPPTAASTNEADRCYSLVYEQCEKNVHLKARLQEISASTSLQTQAGPSDDLAEKLMTAFIEWRAKRDRALGAPRLIHPALQINICAGKLPRADSEGRRLLKIPLRIPEGL